MSYLTARPSKKILLAAHQAITKRWWKTRRRRFALFCSELTRDEAAKGDRDAAARRLRALAHIPLLQATQQAKLIAREILDTHLVPAKAAVDAAHIAIAAAHGMDYLLTWNCTHIANAEIRNGLIGLLKRHGCEAPVICTPEELMGR